MTFREDALAGRHIVISDDTLQFSSKTQISPHSFVAEIVNPDCVSGKRDARNIARLTSNFLR